MTRPRLPGALRGSSLLLAGLWGGSLLSFAAFGARIVLTTSPSRAAGGTVNRALLDALDVSSYVAGGLLLLATLLLARGGGLPPMRRRLLLRLLLFSLAATAASHLVITPEMTALRERMPMAIDLVPQDDPLRRVWGRMHAVSSLALLVRLLAVGGVFALLYPGEERALTADAGEAPEPARGGEPPEPEGDGA